MHTRHRTALLLPLTGFLLVFFVAPLVWLLSLAVREAEVPLALPRTLSVLQAWQPGQVLPPQLFEGFAKDLRDAEGAALGHRSVVLVKDEEREAERQQEERGVVIDLLAHLLELMENLLRVGGGITRLLPSAAERAGRLFQHRADGIIGGGHGCTSALSTALGVSSVGAKLMSAGGASASRA